MSDGRKMASARTIRRISFFSNLLGKRVKEGRDYPYRGKKIRARVPRALFFSHDELILQVTHAPAGEVFHEKVISFGVVIRHCDAIVDVLQLRATAGAMTALVGDTMCKRGSG
jgi:hypothetical protein